MGTKLRKLASLGSQVSRLMLLLTQLRMAGFLTVPPHGGTPERLERLGRQVVQPALCYRGRRKGDVAKTAFRISQLGRRSRKCLRIYSLPFSIWTSDCLCIRQMLSYISLDPALNEHTRDSSLASQTLPLAEAIGYPFQDGCTALPSKMLPGPKSGSPPRVPKMSPM
jgi:hypothetical protein